MSYNKFLYNQIGHEYNRKNIYLLQIAELEEKIKQAKNGEKSILKKELKSLVKNKNTHPYNIRLREYESYEKKFLKELKIKEDLFKSNLDKNLSIKLKALMNKLFLSTEKTKFYKSFIDLSYGAELKYKENKIKMEQLPEIISNLKTLEIALKNADEFKNEIDQSEEKKIKLELEKYKVDQKQILKSESKRLKEMKKANLISEKARKNELTELKNKYKEAIRLKSYDSKTRSVDELIKNKKYEIKNGIKTQENVLKAEVSDIRRKLPMEIEKRFPVIGYFTFLLPGLGQILNKQYIKGLLFFLVSIFIYLIAIPYALGFGNYQGTGLSGLISLAEGGARLDKSLIFMIEGIIALFLVIIALLSMYLSFRDVIKVEKSMIKGIRPNNWFESKTRINQEGFPYLVSFPALILTIFIVLVPISTAILLSFTGMDPKHQSKFPWVGLSNYKLIALGEGLAGSVFWLILRWTVVWTLLATTLAIFVGFSLALIANNERIIGKRFFRTVYLLPWAVPAFITIMFFSIMFSPGGSLTVILSKLLGKTLNVKTDPTAARITLILLQSWLGSAYIFLLSTGVLQAIPADLYEAADIDGASGWQKIRRITLPMVLFQTAPLLVGQYTFNFNNFSIIYLFNGGGPFNPTSYGNLAGSTDLLISYIFKLTMENQYQAIGAAITVVISMGLMFFAFIGFRNSKAFKEERL